VVPEPVRIAVLSFRFPQGAIFYRRRLKMCPALLVPKRLGQGGFWNAAVQTLLKPEAWNLIPIQAGRLFCAP
jgi:hypothetical protein